MRNRLKLFRNLAFAAGIVVALGFGVTQAYATMDCSTPITACNNQGPTFCDGFCFLEYGFGGICNTVDDCCLCMEK